MPTIDPGTSDQRRTPRWPAWCLVASLLLCAGYGTYMLAAAVSPWSLHPSHSTILTALLLLLGGTAVAVLCLFQRERSSRRNSVAAELAHLAGEVQANRSRINELADRTVPIVYTIAPAAHSTMSRDDYWRVYADVLVDLAAV